MDQKDSSSSDEVDDLLDLLLSEPEDAALSLLSTPTTNERRGSASGATEEKKALQNKLRAVCSELFQRIEVLNKLHENLMGRNDVSTLSGLTELYTGENQDDEEIVDAETIFGQIELMNRELFPKAKKSLKQITTSLEMGETVRLLDDENASDSEYSADEGEGSMLHEDDSSSEAGSHADDKDEDEDRKRIEARMRRAMDDMEEEEEEDNIDVGAVVNRNDRDDGEESLVDPAAEELNDGFFDINEMEQFADEEEEYLPDEAFEEEKPDDLADEDKRSFHQKQREGDLDDNEEEQSDEEESELLFKKESSVRRKRYRDEDEIDALYELYQGDNENEQDDDDSVKDAINMTAADLYGKPNKKYFEKWNSRKSAKVEKLDDDSWDEYDFSRDDKDEKKDARGWGAPSADDDGDSSSESGDDDAVDYNDNTPEEQAPARTETKNRLKATSDKLQRQTEELERELIAEKPWQMKGETAGTARPFESLLESTPEFELATKQAPIITVERTMNLEEIIKKRILNEDWDDVVPRELPDVAWNKKQGDLPEVSQEKSKLGLGELYEREYTKKALGYDADVAEKESEEEKVKNEIRGLFANLCSKLDALSNYHFAPRPIADEAEIRPVTQPAIAMEEVLPLHVSEARGVAPEEVYGAKRGRDGVLRGDTELEQQDRKRLRSAKKAARRKARKEKLADEKLISRLQPGLGLNNPYEKRKMREELSAARAQGKITTGETDKYKYGSSGTFFQRMQQEAQHSIKGGTPMDAQETGKRQSKSSAVKL
jgi:U3 small nucleolar RNA-associated protein MPP10